MEQSVSREYLSRSLYINVSKHHTFGTDGVLLAHFAGTKRNDRAIDLGTGCGIIPFLLLRNGNIKSAIGVDISEEAIHLASQSVKEQSIENLTFVHSDLNCLKGKVENGSATLVTCNPPYKELGRGITNPDSISAAARHETMCTLEDIISVSARLLQTGGRLCICLRPERLCELMVLMSKHKIEPKRLRFVHQREGLPPWLFLIEGRRCGNSGMVVEKPLYIEQSGAFSKEMIEIYGDYYNK